MSTIQNLIYISTFKSKKWYDIIKFAERLNNAKKPVSHVAFLFTHQGKKHFFESKFQGGVQYSEYQHILDIYHGKIYNYKALELTDKEMHDFINICNKYLGKKYGFWQMLSSFEFQIIRPTNWFNFIYRVPINIIKAGINELFDSIKDIGLIKAKMDKMKLGFICSHLVIRVIRDFVEIHPKYKEKLLPFLCGQDYEFTPVDIFNILDKGFECVNVIEL